MSKKFRLLMALVLVIGLFGGLMTGSTVSADPAPGKVIEIPRIDLGDVFGLCTGLEGPALSACLAANDWDTQIQVQNTSSTATAYVVAVFWETYSGLCPSNNPGPKGHACMMVPANGIWTLHNQIYATAESALIYSFSTQTLFDTYCKHSSWDYSTWFAAADGPDLAVTVDRWGPDAYGDGLALSASYTGVADPWMVDPGPPYEYFAPYVMHGYNGTLDSTITIQNSGDVCASIWIYYKEQGNCEFMKAHHIELIAPGEAIRIGPGPDADYPYPGSHVHEPGLAPWLGSAYITANVPLAVIVDQLSFAPSVNQGTLLSMRGMPYLGDPRQAGWQEIWYADLLYREVSGWQSSVQVQNLTQKSLPTFVTVEFFDQSGDSILFVGDWVCRNGSRTFYLPAITDLGVNYTFGYFGAAEIESHAQVDYPGNPHDGQPIFAVVDIKKTKVYDDTTGFWRHTFPGETQAGSYNAHPWWQKQNANLWFMPYIAKEQEGVTSRIAIRNNANCNKISGNIYIYDETGLNPVTVIPVPWLHPKHMKLVDLAYFGTVARGFVGAAEFVVENVEQLCDTNHDGITDQLPVMPSVVVLNYGYATELPIGSGAGPWTQVGGDVTRVYEGIPVAGSEPDCYGSLFGTVSVRQEGHGYDREEINGALVSVGDLSDTTDSTGGYQISLVPQGDAAMTVSKAGFFTDTAVTASVECGKETLQDFELVCSNPLYVTVEDTAEPGNAIPGATVTVTSTYEYAFDTAESKVYTGTTDNAGKATIQVAGAPTIVATAAAPGHDPATCGDSIKTDGAGVCYDEYAALCELCKYNTVVGTLTIGDHPAAGYMLDLIDMSVNPPAVVDTDTSTAGGVFSLENLSKAHKIYRINLSNTGGTFISTTGDFDVDTCGATSVFTYTDGVWDDSLWMP